VTARWHTVSNVVKAPWTEEQVRQLNAYQYDRRFHPFTCGSGNRRDVFHTAKILSNGFHDAGQLTATVNGWICAACDYTQDWTLAVMFIAVSNRDEFERRVREVTTRDTVE
jgi:hypothetical protein